MFCSIKSQCNDFRHISFDYEKLQCIFESVVGPEKTSN